jgi:hypothetical protein
MTLPGDQMGYVVTKDREVKAIHSGIDSHENPAHIMSIENRNARHVPEPSKLCCPQSD